MKRHQLEKDPRNGKYYVRIQVDGHRRRFTFDWNLKEAEKALTQLERDIADNKVTLAPPDPEPDYTKAVPTTPGTDMPVRQLADAHLAWVRDNRSPGTHENRTHCLKAFLGFVGEVTVSQITRLVLESFFAWAKREHGKSANGGNAFLRHVKTMFLWADEMGVCACPVKRFPSTPEVLPLTKRFTDEELAKLLQPVTGEFRDFRDMIAFGLLTGLRPQELRTLEKQHVMRDGQGDLFILLERHKTARSARKPISRSVPLNSEATEIVKRQLEAHPESNNVFLNADGNPYKPRSFRQRLLRWCKRAGVQPRPPYALRHTFGSMEAEANINQTSLSQLMGHTTIRTTARYISNNYDHHRNAVAAIEGRVSAFFQKTA